MEEEMQEKPVEGETPPQETTIEEEFQSDEITTGIESTETTETDLLSPYLSEDFVVYAMVPNDMLLVMILGVLLFGLVLGRRVL